MPEEAVRVKVETLRSFMFNVFKKVGVPDGDAETCADVLIAADVQGIDSHGVSRLKPIYYDRIIAKQQHPVTNFEVIREGPTTAVVDGHNGMGMVVGKKAMELAIAKAKKLGMGMVAARNSTHFGIAGYYAQMAVDEGLIGVVGTNARPSIPPTNGAENMLGTNPLTFGMPTDEPFPFMLDCATSIIQRGKVEVYARIGKKVPEGLVIGANGRLQGLRLRHRRRNTQRQPTGRRIPQGSHRHEPRPLLHRHRRQRLHRPRRLQEDNRRHTPRPTRQPQDARPRSHLHRRGEGVPHQPRKGEDWYPPQ